MADLITDLSIAVLAGVIELACIGAVCAFAILVL